MTNTDLARELGAEVVRLRSPNPVHAILDFARSHGVGHVVVGRSQQPFWKQLLGRSVPLQLVREAGGLDVHVVSTEDAGDGDVSVKTKLLLAQAPLAIVADPDRRVVQRRHGASGHRVAAHPRRQLPERARGAAHEGGAGTRRQQRALHSGRSRQGAWEGIARNRAIFERELRVQEGNITEPGEREHHVTLARRLGRVSARHRYVSAAGHGRARRATTSRPSSLRSGAPSSAPTTSWR